MNDLRTAVVCIAKDEDRYIDEWVGYYRKLGFEIIIFANNWKPSLADCTNVRIVEFNEQSDRAQNMAYNKAISMFAHEYDWMAFFDVDEFLVLKQASNIADFLKDFEQYEAVGVNWRIFGDSGLDKPNGEWSVLKRFTKCCDKLNEHIKTILHTAKTGTNVTIESCCHCTQKSVYCDSTINVSRKSYVRHACSLENADENIKIAYLAHFRNKTYAECIEKCRRNVTGIQKALRSITSITLINALSNIIKTTSKTCR